MYHQVDAAPPRGTPMRGLVVSPASFGRHMATLWAMGLKGLSMRDLLPYLNGQKTGRVFGITFDDGYENNLRCALPVLQRFGFSATCYVVVPGAADGALVKAAIGITKISYAVGPDGIRNFCYPYGSFDQGAIRCAGEAGYDTATTTVRGRVHGQAGLNPLTLPRVLVSRTTTCLHLLLKCLTGYEDRRGRRLANTSLIQAQARL
ncbi:MAG: polysaccharide deacetylase family protein [Burkholderiales bacterium]|nr:polysaccharide deacetylase family protein [Burkholderiales bacterium]